jgi:translocation and assembly module TamB
LIKKHVYQIVSLLILLNLLWLVYLPVRKNIVSQLEKVKSNLISGFEKEYNLEVKYRSVSPTIINSIRIRDFSMENKKNGPGEFSVQCERSALYYGLSLFHRNESRIKLQRIVIKKGTLYLSLPEKNEEKSQIIDPEEILKQITPLLSQYFPSGIIELRDIQVIIESGNNVINWNIGLLKLTNEKDVIALVHEGTFRINENIHFTLNTRGSVSLDLESINLSSTVKDFISPYILLDQMEFQMGLNESVLRVSKISDKFPIDLSLIKNGNIWEVNYQSDKFIPSRLLSVGPEWEDYAQWFDIALDGKLKADFDAVTKEINYSVQLQAEGNNSFTEEKLGGYSRLTLNGEGSGWNIQAEELSLATPHGSISYGGGMNLPEQQGHGLLSVKDIQLPRGINMNLDFSLDLEEEQFQVLSKKVLFNDQEGGEINLSGTMDWDAKTSMANLIYMGPLAENLSFDLFGDFSKKPEGKIWYEIDKFKLNDLLELTGYPEVSDKLTLLAGNSLINSNGYCDYSNGKATMRIDSFHFDGDDLDFFFSGYGSPEKIILSDLSLYSGLHRITGSFKGELGDISTFRTRLSYNGNYYDARAEWDRNTKEVLLTGNHGIQGKLSYLDKEMAYVSLTSQEIPFSWDKISAEVKLSLAGMISPEKMTLNFFENQINIEDNPYFSACNITLSGNLDDEILQINQLDWSDRFSKIRGNGKLVLPLDGKSQFNGWLTLLSDQQEKYKLLFFKEGQNYNGYGEFENVMTDRLPFIGKSGRVTAKLDFTDFPYQPVVSGDISATIKNFGTFSTFAHMDQEKLLLSGIQGNYKKANFNSGILSLNRERGDVSLSLGLSGSIGGKKAGGIPKKEWHTGLYAEGESKDFLDFENMNLTGVLKTEEIVFDDETISPPLSFNFEKNDKELSFYNEDRRILNSYYNLNDGDIVITSEKLFPLSFDLRGIIKKDNMDLTINQIDLDLRKMNPFMPIDPESETHIVEFTQGLLKGELTMEGTPASPRINGVILIDPLQLESAYSTKDKGVTKAAIDITENRITIPYLEIPIGQTGAVGAKGQAHLVNWRPEEFDFDFTLIGKNGGAVPVIYPIQGLALSGEVEGDVSFYGAGGEYYITSEILLDRLVMSLTQTKKREPIIPNERKNPWDLKVDLNFITGRDVSMVLPNEDFYIVKANVDIDQRLRLQLDNIPWLFSITGDLTTRSGEISYFDKTFSLTEGRITFDETQKDFDPLMDITAETSISSGNEDVTLIIDYEGSMFSEFDPQFSSIPSYSEREILTLLDPLSSGDSSSIASALGSYADKYTFSAPFEEGLKDVLNVDMVTIETGFVKNIIEDQLNSEEGVYTNDSSEYNVARYLDGTVLNVGKYLGRDLFVSGGIGIDYDESQSALNGLGVDFNVTLEMETPFFNLGWTYLPDDADSVSTAESFVTDSSISINFRL